MESMLVMLLIFFLVLVALGWLGVRRDILGAVALVVTLAFVARIMGVL